MYMWQSLHKQGMQIMKQTKIVRGLVKTCFHCNMFDTSRRAITDSAKAILHAKVCTQGKAVYGA